MIEEILTGVGTDDVRVMTAAMTAAYEKNVANGEIDRADPSRGKVNLTTSLSGVFPCSCGEGCGMVVVCGVFLAKVDEKEAKALEVSYRAAAQAIGNFHFGDGLTKTYESKEDGE